jgi:hypothetical protein
MHLLKIKKQFSPMKNQCIILFLTLAILFTCGCTNNAEKQATTTSTYAISASTTSQLITLLGPKQLIQKGLDNDTFRNRGFYRDDEFIIIGVLQNPNNYPIQVKINYILYGSMNLSLARGGAKDGDIITSYLPAKSTMPYKINCGKIRNIATYKLDWSIKKADLSNKPDDSLKEVNASGEINGNKLAISGVIANNGREKSKNTKITAIFYDGGGKAIDAAYAYTLPMDISPNSSATFSIETTYPQTYTEYLKKIEYYRLWAQDDITPQNITTTTVPIEISGADEDTEIRII